MTLTSRATHAHAAARRPNEYGQGPFVLSERIQQLVASIPEMGRIGEVSLRPSPERRALEFASGRAHAAALLRELGSPSLHVGVGSCREPVWPHGFVGSITHGGGLVGVAAAHCCEVLSVGIDIEPIMSSEHADEVARVCATEDELQLFVGDGWSFREAVTLLFSLKEALFKCLFPRIGRFVEFEGLRATGVQRTTRGTHAAIALSGSNHADASFCGDAVIYDKYVYTCFELPSRRTDVLST